jgi:hypothetical protein
MRRTLRLLLLVVLSIVLAVASVWAAAALYFDFPVPGLRVPVAALYVCLMAAALLLLRNGRRIMVAYVGAFVMVLIWWFSLEPPDNKDWQPDVDRTAWAEINDNHVTIHNVRNCDYRTELDYTPHWETRSYDLSKIRGLDLFVTHWGPTLIAHPILSFTFDEGLPLAFSIEARKITGQSYSAIRGFFRQFTVIYVIADERDVVRLRTNYRKGEEVIIYHTRATPERARAMFHEFLKPLNQAHERPTWYNALTNNCTTGIRKVDVATSNGSPQSWNWRFLLNGSADQLVYDRGEIAGDSIPFSEFVEKAHINDAARAADQAPDFSRRIRLGRPGF